MPLRESIRSKLYLVAGVVLFVGLVVVMARAAKAHELWDDGSPVPESIKAICCGKSDAHLLRDEDVHLDAAGWHIKGYEGTVPPGHELPSPDGRFWAFWKDFSDGTQSNIYCFFVPKGTT